MSDFHPGAGWRQVPNKDQEPDKERLYHWVGTTLTCWVKDEDEARA